MITEITLLPDDMDWGHHELHSFAIRIKWRGFYSDRRKPEEPKQHWYSVEGNGCSLSRGGKWVDYVEPFRRQQYRFSLAEAETWAAKVVNKLMVHGHTWAQWKARFDDADQA